MPKTIEFHTVERDGNVYIIDQNYLQAVATNLNVEALTTEEVEKKYGDAAKKRTITLKPASYRLKSDIARLSQRQDEEKGLVHDPELVQAARAAAVVESWNLDDVDGKPAPVSVEGFMNLPMIIGEYTDYHIFRYLCPEISNDSFFLEMLSSKLTPIAAN